MIIVTGEAPASSSEATAAVRVLVIDRNTLFRAGIALLLSEPPINASVVAESRSEAVRDRIAAGEFDLVLCEVNAEPISGAELVGVIRDARATARLMLVGCREERGDLISALDCGAAAYFTKEMSWEEFAEGLRAVQAGHIAVAGDLATPTFVRLAGPARPAEGPGWEILSEGERVTLQMVGQAQSIDEIATSRGISRKTVRNHLAMIYRKLDIESRTEAMLWAVRSGLVDGNLDKSGHRD